MAVNYQFKLTTYFNKKNQEIIKNTGGLVARRPKQEATTLHNCCRVPFNGLFYLTV
jgi:hypothetical protein